MSSKFSAKGASPALCLPAEHEPSLGRAGIPLICGIPQSGTRPTSSRWSGEDPRPPSSFGRAPLADKSEVPPARPADASLSDRSLESGVWSWTAQIGNWQSKISAGGASPPYWLRRVWRGCAFGAGNRKSEVISSLLRWYRNYGRDLPWRNEHDPYRVLVSEVMLQQTQVSRVLLKYPMFLKRFPTFEKLARAKVSDVILAWQGMGYNNRALRLRLLAKAVAYRYNGMLPRDVAELQNLPGIGRYTAHAVSCFAFGNQVPVVDTNVARLLSRLYPEKIGPKLRKRNNPKRVCEIAEWILPRHRAYEWNQALMDLGATICTARTPKCGVCPLRSSCPSAYSIREQRITSSTREPGRDGLPNRIYRGRVVEVLRNLNGRKSIDVRSLARKIKPDYNGNDGLWFKRLLRSLERDGLVRLWNAASIQRVSLPD